MSLGGGCAPRPITVRFAGARSSGSPCGRKPSGRSETAEQAARAVRARLCRTVPKDSVVARRCRCMGPVIVPGVDGGELVRARFLAFYDAAVGPLFGYPYRATGGQRELAEDLCQDVFATVLTRMLSPASGMGPLERFERQWHGTT